MATLSPFFPLMKGLLCSSLVLLFLASFPDNSHALRAPKLTKGHHFHTIDISSLLPASVCSHSAAAKGSGKRQSTLEVLHRHGPCSDQLATGRTTPMPALSELLADDQSRADSIQARLAPRPNRKDADPNKEKIEDEKTTLPAKSGISLGTGSYIVIVGLGTPTRTLTLSFDTGSDLTWTQCQPCLGSCYKQQDQIFDPSSSSSYSNISCGSPQCSQVPSATGIAPGCTSNTCLYRIRYGDGSSTAGFVSKDKLTIPQTDVFPDFVFGCGQDNRGLFRGIAGLLGLGRDPLSVVSQTAQKYGKYFSYCLPSTSSSTGRLTFGKNGAPNNLQFTALDSSRGPSFYYIDLVSISVGGQRLSISPSVFKTAGTVIDSGTTITRLPPDAYISMRSAFRQLMQQYPSAPAVSLFDTCYDFGSNNPTITIPEISFTFSNNVEMDLDASGILLFVSETRACLAFAGNSDASDVGILGNTQQKTFEVAYDVAGGKLGFAPGAC